MSTRSQLRKRGLVKDVTTLRRAAEPAFKAVRPRSQLSRYADVIPCLPFLELHLSPPLFPSLPHAQARTLCLVLSTFFFSSFVDIGWRSSRVCLDRPCFTGVSSHFYLSLAFWCSPLSTFLLSFSFAFLASSLFLLVFFLSLFSLVFGTRSETPREVGDKGS